jgi:putative FmdB family regulatory protein
MPIYEYECDNCGATFQRIYMSPEDRPTEIVCPECEGSDVHQLFSPPTVHSGEATDVVEEAAEQVEDQGTGRPRAFDQQDLDDVL